MGVQPVRRLSLNDVMMPVGLLVALCVFGALFPWSDFDRLAGREGTVVSWTSLNRVIAPRHVSAQFSLCLGTVRTTCVADADTIWLEGEEILIADIDAPEMANPRCAAERELGLRAMASLTQWLNEAPFEMLPTSADSWSRGGDVDAHGRKLRVLERDGKSAADALVAAGVARRRGAKGKRWC
ncbi:MAG: thermonuclease family protein [Erythrobacter sp.]|nr:thermonuclease family protein [Erythrobacter sp.]